MVLVRPRAERDIAKARAWYELKQRGLGREFLNEVAVVIRALEANPARTSFYYRNFRRLLLRKFPYKVFYQIVGSRVVVFRVLHSKQDHERKLFSNS
jgi:plasmid stabilization system protein ParE